MELIVKIGADMQGLKDSISRMKEMFRQTDLATSSPWSGMSLTPGQRAAMNAGLGGTGLEGYVEKSVVKKSTQYLKGILFAELAQIAAGALDILGQKFWESIYGVSDRSIARISESHKRIRNAVTNLRESETRNRDDLQKRELGVEGMRDLAKKEFLEAEAELRYAKNATAQSTDVMGNPLKPWQRQSLVVQLAEAEKKELDARMKLRELEDQLYRIKTDEFDRSLSEHRKKQQDRDASKGESFQFQADNLASSALFSGSSLLFNPAMNIEQQQLEVLRVIADNTGQRSTAFSP